ncbi:MAG: DUF4350 domain-containing protein [Gammaproteobacteria bacterium]|nr:DUF4350 domain-containing protein [Gammaproteobacteria bacterium]MYC97936.1 DUF4350 domain-containing protein [Gammaproteobacteria bacterium]
MTPQRARPRDGTAARADRRTRGSTPPDAGWGVLAAIAVVTLLLVVTAFALRPSGSSARDVRRSALRTTPDGVAGLYRAIARLGPPTAIRATPLVDAESLRGTLVMLQPARRPSPREVHELLEWVRGGGTLIHAPRRASPILDSLGLVRRTLLEEGDSAEASGASPGAELDDGPLWSGDHPLTEGLPVTRAARYAIAPDTASAEEGEENDADEEEEPGPPPVPHHPLLLSAPDSASHRWAVAVSIPLRDGRIISLADAAPLSNRFADEAPLAVLAVRAAIAWTSPGDSVFFDEFSQGLGASRSPARATVDFLVDTPVGRASLHLGVVVLLAFLCAGLRFGAPLAPAGGPGRSSLEHVTALAAVYESAHARETAAVLMLGRLARTAHLPPPHDLRDAERLLERLEKRTARPRAIRLIRRGLGADPVDLVRVAQGIDNHTQGRTSA